MNIDIIDDSFKKKEKSVGYRMIKRIDNNTNKLLFIITGYNICCLMFYFI